MADIGFSIPGRAGVRILLWGRDPRELIVHPLGTGVSGFLSHDTLEHKPVSGLLDCRVQNGLGGDRLTWLLPLGQSQQAWVSISVDGCCGHTACLYNNGPRTVLPVNVLRIP